MIKKIINRIKKYCYGILNVLNCKKFKVKYPNYLRKIGINIPLDYYENEVGFIHPTVYFDGTDYSLISVGKNTTISMNVTILTHDFSIVKGLQAMGLPPHGHFEKSVTIGNNCFIGANSFILPGTTLGDNVIVGAGSVVRGYIPNDSIVIGNPASIIGNTIEWTKKHLEKKDIVR